MSTPNNHARAWQSDFSVTSERSRQLVGLREQGTMRIHQIASKRCAYLLGSGAAADIRIADGQVSRVHCALVRDDHGRVIIVDRDSRNGTFINDVRCERAYLHAGAQLRVGRTTLIAFNAESPDMSPLEARQVLRAAVASSLARGSVRAAARSLGIATSVLRQLADGLGK